MTPTIVEEQRPIRILDIWEYVKRRLPGASIGEIETALHELEMVGIMRNASFSNQVDLRGREYDQSR